MVVTQEIEGKKGKRLVCKSSRTRVRAEVVSQEEPDGNGRNKWSASLLCEYKSCSRGDAETGRREGKKEDGLYSARGSSYEEERYFLLLFALRAR